MHSDLLNGHGEQEQEP